MTPSDKTAEKKEYGDEFYGRKADALITALKQELQTKEEYLKSANEELETSNEELKSANEEMQSVNEELQSTNEELETSKEELQSVNEELSTVNTELQTKVFGRNRCRHDLCGFPVVHPAFYSVRHPGHQPDPVRYRATGGTYRHQPGRLSHSGR